MLNQSTEFGGPTLAKETREETSCGIKRIPGRYGSSSLDGNINHNGLVYSWPPTFALENSCADPWRMEEEGQEKNLGLECATDVTNFEASKLGLRFHMVTKSVELGISHCKQ